VSSQELYSLACCWASAWGGSGPADWVALYTPNATYTDHAFQIRRTGTALLERHWHIWRTAIPDFVMEIERFNIPMEVKPDVENMLTFSVRTINRGTLLRDLPSKKASGKEFVFRGVVDFKVNGDGLIENIEEWYTWDFGEGRDVKDYHSLPAEKL